MFIRNIENETLKLSSLEWDLNHLSEGTILASLTYTFFLYHTIPSKHEVWVNGLTNP